MGFNITLSDIDAGGGKTRKPWAPFNPHTSTVGFEQFDCNAWGYESRFAAAPAGVVYPPSGRDGAGILFIIGGATATTATDLEVYVMDANVGGEMFRLTSNVTDGTANAINHLYASADGNFLIGQRSKTTSNSRGSRAFLNGRSYLFAVTNVHAVLGGATPVAFNISSDVSHGSTVAFIGEGTATGAQAIVFSSGTASLGSNQSWDDRQLKLGFLAPGQTPSLLDAAKSHYVVVAGARTLDDDPCAAE